MVVKTIMAIIIILLIIIIIIIITIIAHIAVPGDGNILQKETEKCEKYQDLAREIQRIWKSRTKVVPVVVGALDSVSKKLAGHLEQLGIKNRTRTMQKSALLGSAHILRKVLEVWGLGMGLDWMFLPRGNPCAKFYIIIITIIQSILSKTNTFWPLPTLRLLKGLICPANRESE